MNSQKFSHPAVEKDFLTAQSILETNDLSKLNGIIDSTLLKPQAHKKEFIQLCEEALKFKFRSVCLPPCYVNLAKTILNQSPDTSLCTVIGFPNGYNLTRSKVFEIEKALEEGADEIDFVQNISLVKSELWHVLQDEYEAVAKAAKNKVTKVILETSLLTENEIYRCSSLAAKSGIHIVKTSTGFGSRGASTDDVKTIRKALDEFASQTGIRLGIKASGGVKKKEDAFNLLQCGATRFGTSNGCAILSGTETEKNSY